MKTVVRLLAVGIVALAAPAAHAWMIKLIHQDGTVEYVKEMPYDLYDPNRPRWPHMVIINNDAEIGPIVPGAAASPSPPGYGTQPAFDTTRRTGPEPRVLYRMGDRDTAQ